MRTTLFIQKQFNLLCEYFAKYSIEFGFKEYLQMKNLIKYLSLLRTYFDNYSVHRKQLIYRESRMEFPCGCLIPLTISTLNKLMHEWKFEN